MLRRAACAAFILYQAVWLAAVVPGHTRGRVTLPGAAAGAPQACDSPGGHACCHREGATRGAPGNPQPSPDACMRPASAGNRHVPAVMRWQMPCAHAKPSQHCDVAWQTCPSLFAQYSASAPAISASLMQPVSSRAKSQRRLTATLR